MAQDSKIEWTEMTWNPVTGCTKISPGCDNCYAERFAERFRGVPGHPYEAGFDLTLRPHRLEQPLTVKQPKTIFVNSMSDLFHKEVPFGYVDRVFDTMEKADWHVFQVLTKRSSRMRDYVNKRYRNKYVPTHIWLGTSVEDGRRKSRAKHLSQIRNAIRFLSVEPLVGPIGEIDLTSIDWVIVGGESGPGFREMKEEWVAEVHRQCQEQGAIFFFKQWGGFRPKSNGREFLEQEWNGLPEPDAENPAFREAVAA